jgi:hypothetical protein
MTLPDLFRRIASSLEQAGIDYMLTGSYASTIYGMERASQDIDLVISADEAQVRTFLRLLSQNNFYVESNAAGSLPAQINVQRD